ncbi:MAG TPA: hypothetical protein VFI20_09265 [Terracidiphilus sp.]|nr:hypothetical protein [Terracidiphilus sp.]
MRWLIIVLLASLAALLLAAAGMVRHIRRHRSQQLDKPLADLEAPPDADEETSLQS